MAAADVTRFSGRTAWARSLETPLSSFLRTETGSATILAGAALAALVWVNVDASSYHGVWETDLSIRIGDYGISQTLRHWVNSGLMTFFFLVTGLEARRELDLGEHVWWQLDARHGYMGELDARRDRGQFLSDLAHAVVRPGLLGEHLHNRLERLMHLQRVFGRRLNILWSGRGTVGRRPKFVNAHVVNAQVVAHR